MTAERPENAGIAQAVNAGMTADAAHMAWAQRCKPRSPVPRWRSSGRPRLTTPPLFGLAAQGGDRVRNDLLRRHLPDPLEGLVSAEH
jgi:hypothetical protein